MSEAPEFSAPVELDGLPGGGRTIALKPSAAACAAIATRLGVGAVKAFGGEMTIRANRTRIDITGALRAVVTRQCVASLEDFDEAIEEEFVFEFLRIADTARGDDDEEEGLDTPECYEDPVMDLGELLVQQLSLAMDPFPRKPEAASLAAEYGQAEESSAFSGLAALLEKDDKNQ